MEDDQLENDQLEDEQSEGTAPWISPEELRLMAPIVTSKVLGLPVKKSDKKNYEELKEKYGAEEIMEVLEKSIERVRFAMKAAGVKIVLKDKAREEEPGEEEDEVKESGENNVGKEDYNEDEV